LLLPLLEVLIIKLNMQCEEGKLPSELRNGFEVAIETGTGSK